MKPSTSGNYVHVGGGCTLLFFINEGSGGLQEGELWGGDGTHTSMWLTCLGTLSNFVASVFYLIDCIFILLYENVLVMRYTLMLFRM